MADVFGMGALSAVSGAAVTDAVAAYLVEHPVTSGATETERTQIEQNTAQLSAVSEELEALSGQNWLDDLKAKLTGSVVREDLSLASAKYGYSTTKVVLIDTYPIDVAVRRIDSLTVRLGGDAAAWLGIGHFDEAGQFLVTEYTEVTGTGADEEQTVRVGFTPVPEVDNHLCILLRRGGFRFRTSSRVSDYATAQVTGVGDLAQAIVPEYVTGNGIVFAYLAEAYKAVDGDLAIAEAKPANKLYVAADGTAQYTSIQDAINVAKQLDGPDNQVTIYVAKGVYDRFDLYKGTHYIDIIGEGRELVTVKSTAGVYSAPAACLATNGIIRGITFLATHDDITELPEGDMGSYAVHADYWTFVEGRKFVFEDCDFISYQTAAFGCGLWNNETLVLRGCNFYSYCDPAWNTSESNAYPALTIHGAVQEENDTHHVIVENCKAWSQDCANAVTIYRYRSDTTMDIEIRNSQFYSGTGGMSCRVDTQYLTPLSAGNNIPSLNYSAE